MNKNKKKIRCLVVGSGPSGIAAAKALLEWGATVQVIERGSSLGGLWRHDEQEQTQEEEHQLRRQHEEEERGEGGVGGG